MIAGIVSGAISGGTHTSRTIQVPGLTMLLDYVPSSAAADEYKDAVVEQNVLGKRTLDSRRRTYRYLRELYALDPDVLLFRSLRDLWCVTPAEQPLLAMLCALARDPSLRATSKTILALSAGQTIAASDLAAALMERYPGSYSAAVANKVGRNAASSWTQSGHLRGRSQKVRTSPVSGPATAAYALLLGHLEGGAGGALLESAWASVLDVSPLALLDYAMAASQRGLLDVRHGGGVTQITFRHLLRGISEGAVL